MKYTRYDYKKKKNDMITVLIVLASVLIAAFLLGTAISSMIIKQSGNNVQVPLPKNTPVPNNEQSVAPEDTAARFIVIQSGFFKNKEFAEELKNKIKEQAIPFTIIDGDSIRIMAGIFTEEESNKFIQILNEKQIPNTKTVFEINKNELCDAEIAEIINGNIKILNKLMEKDVASVGTADFKGWIANSLKAVDAKSKNYSLLEELKNYVNSLPGEIGKDKVEENYVFLYNTLKKVTGK